jgi:hypothetical protein
MNKSMFKTRIVDGKINRDLIDVPKLDFSDIEKSMKKLTKIVEGLSYGIITSDSDFIDFKNEKIDNFIQTESNKVTEKLQTEIINYIKEQAKKIEDYWVKVINCSPTSYYSDGDTGPIAINLDSVKDFEAHEDNSSEMLKEAINTRMTKGRVSLEKRVSENKKKVEEAKDVLFSNFEENFVNEIEKKAAFNKKKNVYKKGKSNGKK